MTQVTIDQALQMAWQYQSVGNLAEAEGIYRQILAQYPDNAEALGRLGTLTGQTGRYEVAVELLGKAIALCPTAELHCNRGEFYRRWGKPDEAIEAFRRAIAIDGNYADAHNNLGIALCNKGQLDDAIGSFDRAIELRPEYAEAHNNKGVALQAKERHVEAIGAFRRALELHPAYGEAHNNLGNSLKKQGNLREAIASFRQAIQLKPDLTEAHNNLGAALRDAGTLDEAEAVLRHAIRLRPDFAEAFNNLGSILKDLGRVDEALAMFDRASSLKPGNSSFRSNRLLTLHYDPFHDAATIFEQHRDWDHRHALPLRSHIRPHDNDRSFDRPLKIGYISPDLRQHSVAFFLLPLLECRSCGQIHVTCYSSNTAADAVTDRIRQSADDWRSLAGLSDEQAAARIRQDHIDILVDLAGHTAGGRPLIFARKPAPVQAAYLGYPGTTGLEAIDYRLSDEWADPRGTADAHSTEKIVRLPETAWCFTPLSGSPEVGELPSVPNNYVTFGTFNNFAKVSRNVLELWVQILKRTPGSHLLLKNKAMSNESAIRRMHEFFADRGVDVERLELIPPETSLAGHLQWYRRLDIGLDTFPYHGTTTTCEALWMGVPVVTLAGQTHASRVGVSLLTNAGLQELVARSDDEYVKIAAELAGDHTRLQQLRVNLRERMKQSPLMDSRGFACNVETAYREMWRKYCASGS